MNYWSILGIDPTSDIKTIRRAYAKQSVLCHPEEKPEEFKRLHIAYQQALHAAEGLGERDEETEQGNEPICAAKPYESAEQTESNNETEQKAQSELDFDALFAESAGRQMQEALESGALKGIADCLRDPKKRNNKAVWKEFFFSNEYLAFHIKPGSLTLLAEYLRQQKDVPADDLPRVFCVWLSIVAGVRYYEESGNAAKLETLSPITGLLAAQSKAQYNQSEMKKADYDLNRLCFAMFNGFLDEYPALCETTNTEAWVSALGTVENNYHHRPARADYCKILVFIVNHMRLPSSVLVQMFRQYEMDNFERSSMKNDYKPLYEALTKGGKESLMERVREQDASNQLTAELLKSIHNILQKYHVFSETQTESDRNVALAKMSALTEEPGYRDVWFSPNFMKRFEETYCSGIRRESEGFRQFLRVIQAMYVQNKAKPGVESLLVSISQTLEQNEARESTMAKEPPLNHFGFPEKEDKHFAVLKELDGIIMQMTEGFSYRDNVLLALFAMARTCVITNILSPISEDFERYYLRHIREMPDYLLKWLMGEPVKKEDCSWWIIKSIVNSMTREVHFDGEDVKAVTNTPEIIFANYKSFLETWFHFARFEYKPDDMEVKPGMTGGFVLYPASMLIRMGYEYDEEELTALLNSEWGRIQDDIALLSTEKTYTELSERLNKYLPLNIFLS